jgi:hypothetical protein
MILKTLTHDHGNSDVWNYYDNITAASVYYDESIGEVVVSMSQDAYDGSIVLAVPEGAYLLNDKGETIERIRPAEKIGSKEAEPIKVRVKCELVGE